MKKTLMTGGLAALALAVAGGAAIAQQAAQTSDRAPHDRVSRADADGDNRLSQAEFVGSRLQRLTAADADRDGSVTADERRAAHQARRAQRADARFARLDADKDGAISRAEFDAAREARGDRGARSMRGHRGRGHGSARAGRMEARGPVVIADARTRAEQAFTRLDADQDGFVTADERRAGRQAMREHRRERMAERRAARQARSGASPSAPASE